MSVWRKLNPLEWSRETIIRVFATFFVVALPLWFSGFTVFATNINPPSATLKISNIELDTPVSSVEIKGGQLETPDTIAGAYTNGNKVFLYGHSTGVFRQLDRIEVGDIIEYGEGETLEQYRVTRLTYNAVETISMAQLLKDVPKKQLVLMTCAGEQTSEDNFTERLIIYTSLVSTYASE